MGDPSAQQHIGNSAKDSIPVKKPSRKSSHGVMSLMPLHATNCQHKKNVPTRVNGCQACTATKGLLPNYNSKDTAQPQYNSEAAKISSFCHGSMIQTRCEDALLGVINETSMVGDEQEIYFDRKSRRRFREQAFHQGLYIKENPESITNDKDEMIKDLRM